MAKGALDGIRVADLTRAWAGPHCTQLLGEMGAEVIKIEQPSGDGTRGGRNPVPGSGTYPNMDPGLRPYNRAGVFNQVNRNKRSVALDLTKPRGKEVFKELVKRSHVVIDNYSAGVMNKLGLGYNALSALKPAIVMASMPAYGMTGPISWYRGYGVALEPQGGLFSLTGYYEDDLPYRSGVDHLDPLQGTHMAGGILAALIRARRTGKGQFIDMSHVESTACVLGEAIMDYTMNGRVQTRMGNRLPGHAPCGCYRCKGEERWVTISVSSDEEWQALCRVMGSPAWTKEEGFADALGRGRNYEALDRLIEGWTQGQDNYDLMLRLQEAGCPAGVVATAADLYNDPHLKKREFFPKVTHPEAGTFPQIGTRWRMSKTPNQVYRPAPCFAQHNDYVFRDLLGMSEGEIARLYEEEVTLREPVD